ncbi:type II secretion system minor pseudopilin [Chitinimonas naiadis]
MRSRQQGFILVLTLFVLAASAIAVGFFGERVERALADAAARQRRTDGLVALDNTRAELLFRFATSYVSPIGLMQGTDILSLDDTLYQGDQGTLLQVQDTNGLFNLNTKSPEKLAAFLKALDVADERIPRLVDTLLDYTDPNSTLHRLNGATAADYIAAGMQAPANRPLLSPLELQRVLGWRELVREPRDATIESLTTTAESKFVNPGTASWQVLFSLGGMTRETAKWIVAQRDPLRPFDATMLAGANGVDTSRFQFTALPFPSDTLRVTQAIPGYAVVLRYNVTFTPDTPGGPWRIDNFYRIERREQPDTANGTTPPSEPSKVAKRLPALPEQAVAALPAVAF